MPRLLLIGLLWLTAPLAAHASPPWLTDGHGGARPAPRFEPIDRRQGPVGPGEAARAARDVYGGRVLAVHAMNGPRGMLYRVRLLVDGQVRVVLVEARTGRVLR